MSRPSEPVETTSMSSITSPSPSRMIEPLPNCFSVCAGAACRALAFSVFRALTGASILFLQKVGALSQKLDVCTVIREALLLGYLVRRRGTGWQVANLESTRRHGDNAMRILIAEDDQVLADGLLRSLRNAGYAVDQVGSGSEADAALAAHEFDLVILDLGLPKIHGLEVLRKLRARGSSVPVLVLPPA